MPDAMRVRSSSDSSMRRTLLNARIVVAGASAGRGRHASTMDDAKELVPTLIMRPPRSLRTGQVAVISQPLWISPSSNAYQPVDVPVLSSFCLYA